MLFQSYSLPNNGLVINQSPRLHIN
uniref:Uncharacterized protein n=1 Tax=Lepeophtheirus salmonis TaxID=72036 RepID=A0A0K2UT79_LEPSM